MNGIITLENMPNEYVQLKGELLYEMVDKGLELVGLGELCKLTSISFGKILKFHCIKDRRKTILISDLRNLSKFLVSRGYSQYLLESLQHTIISIGRYKGILEPRFPIDFTIPEGGEIIADILTDGSISRKFRVSYTNIDPIQIIKNLKTMNKLFANYQIPVTKSELENLFNKELTLKILRFIAKRSKIKCRVYKVKEKPNPAYSIRYHACIGKIINVLGIPKGNKLKSNPYVPKFLFNSPKETIFKFIERILINEGHTTRLHIKLGHSIDVTPYLSHAVVKKFISNPKRYMYLVKNILESNENLRPNLLKDYKILFSLVNCKTSKITIKQIKAIGNEIHPAYSFHITGSSLDIIKDNCDLNSSHKLEKLSGRETIKRRFPIEIRLKQIIRIANELRKFKSRDVAKELNITICLASQYLNKLVKSKKLIRKGKGPATYYELVT